MAVNDPKAGGDPKSAFESKPGETTRTDERLEDQIAKLQDDVKSIAATLQKLTGEKLDEARRAADGRYEDAVRHGRHMLDDVTDQASEFEHSLKQTIRDKPLTAVASALGIGYVLAMLSRR